MIYKYTIEDALSDGKVIVPWVVTGWEGGEVDLDTACIQMMKEKGGHAMVNAVSIDDAINFAELATANDYPTKCVHSKMSERETEVLRWHRHRIGQR